MESSGLPLGITEIVILVTIAGSAISAILYFTVFKKSKPKDIPRDLADTGKIETPNDVELIAETLPTDLDKVETTEPVEETKPASEISPAVEEPQQKDLSEALSNTKQSFFGRIKGIFSSKEVIKADELDEIEEILYTSDLGPKTVQILLDAVEKELKSEGQSGLEAVRNSLKSKMLEIFSNVPKNWNGSSIGGLEKINTSNDSPTVWMIVGVNGAGKTTTIGKLAGRLAEDGKKVLLAAGDTFRAAAGEQLNVWTDRAQVEIFNPEEVKDPSAVAFDAIQKGKARGFDVVIVDTAGRLHTQKNLMEELKKMKRVVKKVMEDAPHETLLVLDANSGQNALVQANEFHEALDVTGVVLTKMDGTAKGGVALGVAHELKIPVKLIGVGEGIHDLRNFEATEYVDSII